MGGGHGHEHDSFPGEQPAEAVNDGDIDHGKAAPRLRLHLGQLAFGHAGIMFEGHGANPILATTHQTDETGDGPDIGSNAPDMRQLDTGIEVFALHADHRPMPPVTGGKKATSVAPEIVWSEFA